MSAPVLTNFAYSRLRPVEKANVDSIMSQLERQSERTGRSLRDMVRECIENARDTDQILSLPLVQAALEERAVALSIGNMISPDRILKELACMAFSNIKDYMQDNARGETMMDFSRVPPEKMAAIKKLKILEQGGVRRIDVELHEKISPIKMLAEYQGMLQADNPHYRMSNAQPLIPVGASHDAAAEIFNAHLADQ
jgi:hypothetical protein